MVTKLLAVLSLLIACSLRANSIFFFTPTPSPGCLSNINNQPARIDCYPAGTNGVVQTACETLGCNWCPSNIANQPWCIDGCDTIATAIDCFSTPTTGVTLASCIARNVCKYCSNVPTGAPICQANYNDCLVNGRVDAKPTGTTGVTRNSCENMAPTGLYCPSRTPGIPWCIVPQPAAARCFNTARAVFGTSTTQCECHRAGGVYCTTAPNLNRCISLPSTAPSTCPSTGRQQCFPNGVATPTQTQCEAIGCTWCAGTALPNCIYAIRTTPACA